MTKINTALTEAIAKCDEIKARLGALCEMSEPKPVLRLESITRPGHWQELQSADDLISCPVGTVIASSKGHRYLRGNERHAPWATSCGTRRANDDLWRSLISDDGCGVTFKYLAAD